jgi:single-strand DNA-binding protein
MTMTSIPFTGAGNLTDDPELRHTGSGKPVAAVRVAITPRHYDQTKGAYLDGATTFVDAQVWGEQAEHLTASLHRGDRVIVVGRWVTRTYTPDRGPNEGREMRRMEVVIDEIGPSLAWATATVTVTKTSGTTAGSAA